MAEVTREEIIDVFGSVAPDYSDIPTDVWGQVVSSLYGMERAEFDAFVDELEAGSRQGGTPDIRRSLVLIYDNAKRDVRGDHRGDQPGVQQHPPGRSGPGDAAGGPRQGACAVEPG